MSGNGNPANRKRSKNVFPLSQEGRNVVFPRNIWYGLSKSGKAHAVSANDSYKANDVSLNLQNQSTRQQSRMSLQIIAKMSGAMPGSDTDGGCPVLLRDLAESTKALVKHQGSVRAYVNTNAQILSAIAEYEPPAPENRTEQDTDESIQRHLILRGLMQLLASYPSTLLYDNDDSLFEVDDVNNDAPMA